MRSVFYALVVMVLIGLTGCDATSTGPVEYGRDGVVKNGTIDTQIGELTFESGYPSRESVEKLFDAMDFQRATQAYIWALPIVSMVEWQHVHENQFKAGDAIGTMPTGNTSSSSIRANGLVNTNNSTSGQLMPMKPSPHRPE